MNGNDFVEIIEANTMRIDEDFLMQFTNEQLRDFILNERDFERIKKENDYDDFAQKWAEHHTEV
jgi:hypothetical protein